MNQLRNNQPDLEPEENEFDELDKEFLFSILLSLSGLFLVVVLACAAAWFLIA
jgi:hypothetical protein